MVPEEVWSLVMVYITTLPHPVRDCLLDKAPGSLRFMALRNGNQFIGITLALQESSQYVAALNWHAFVYVFCRFKNTVCIFSDHRPLTNTGLVHRNWFYANGHPNVWSRPIQQIQPILLATTMTSRAMTSYSYLFLIKVIYFLYLPVTCNFWKPSALTLCGCSSPTCFEICYDQTQQPAINNKYYTSIM